MKQYFGVIVPKSYDALRLDAFLKRVLPPLERIAVLRMLKDKEIRVEKTTAFDKIFQTEPINVSTFHPSLLTTLEQTEPAILDSSTSNFVIASSSIDTKKRSEYV